MIHEPKAGDRVRYVDFNTREPTGRTGTIDRVLTVSAKFANFGPWCVCVAWDGAPPVEDLPTYVAADLVRDYSPRPADP